MSVYIIQTDILHKKVDRCIMMVLKGKMKEHTKKNEINPEAYNKNSGSCFYASGLYTPLIQLINFFNNG